MSERFESLKDFFLREVDPNMPHQVTAVYIPENEPDLAQVFDIPFEYEAFKNVIGDDFFDIPVIQRKIIVFISNKNEHKKDGKLEIKNDIPGKIKGDMILVGGDEEWVQDLDDISAFFYASKINRLLTHEYDNDNREEERTEGIEPSPEEESKEENEKPAVIAEDKGTST